VAARILFPFSFYFNQQDRLRFLAFAGLSLGLKASRTVADISESLINRTLTKINQHEVCVYIPHYNQHPILLTHETLSESKTGSAPLGQARNTAQATTITAALLALYLPIAKAEPDKVHSARADIEFFATLKLILLRLNP